MGSIKKMAAEPSSWAGLASVLQAAALVIPQYGAALNLLTAVCGAVAMAKRETGAAPGVEP